MNKITGLLLAVALCGWIPPTTAAASELNNLIAEALEANPELRAHESMVSAAEARIPQAAALDDPRIGFRASNLPLSDFGLNNTPMTGLDFTISQKIPFPGKLGLRKRAERFEASAAASLYGESQNRIRYQVAQTYYQLYRIDREIDIIRKNLSLLHNLTQTAEARYATGQATGPDVFRAQTFASQLENALLSLEQERDSMAIRLNTILDRPSDTPLHFHYRFPLSRVPAEETWSDTVKERPLLKALEYEVEAADERIRLAKRDYWPDFDFMFGYRLRGAAPGDPVSGSDFISGGVTLNIPLWAHWRERRKVEENAARKLAATYQYGAMQNESTYQASEAHQRLKRQYNQIKLYQSRLLPQARATYESSLSSYETELIGFFSTIEALKDSYEIERDYYMLRAEYEISLARLKWIIGAPNRIAIQAEVSS